MSSDKKGTRRTARDVPLAVQWHDGMQLSPQHFQESFHRVARYIDYHLDLGTPYHYGVIGKISFEGLATGKLRVVELEAVMPDDTIVLQTAQDPDLKVDLKPRAAKMKGAPATIYLAIPKEYPGQSVGGELARYRSVEGEAVPDENTGDNALVIPRLVPKMSLLVVAAGDEPESRYVAMPIAKVLSEGDSFTLVNSYIPPCMNTPGGTPLAEFCRELSESLREKAKRLDARVKQLSMTTDRDLIATMTQQIRALVSALPPFEVLLWTDQAHPFQLYLALASVFASVSALAKDRVPNPLPRYEHDDIRTVFLAAKAEIDRIVKEGILETFDAHPFDISDGRFRVDIKPPWAGTTLVVAVKARRGVTPPQLMSWMENALIGSLNKVRDMQDSRFKGIKREQVAEIDGLVATESIFLYKLTLPDRFLEVGAPLGVFNPADPAAVKGPSEVILYVKTKNDDGAGSAA